MRIFLHCSWIQDYVLVPMSLWTLLERSYPVRGPAVRRDVLLASQRRDIISWLRLVEKSRKQKQAAAAASTDAGQGE